MKASAMNEFKDTAKLPLLETTLEVDEVLIKVRGASVNQMYLIQHRYEIKTGEKVSIRECSGRIIKVGSSVKRWRIGDKVCALVNEKGYADEVVVSSEWVLRAPSHIPLLYAAGLPVVSCYTYIAIDKCLQLKEGEVLVIHEVNFHFTLFAIRRAKSRGLKVFVVTDLLQERKLRWIIYKGMGAKAIIYSRKVNVVEQVLRMSKMKGANGVLCYGADQIREYSQCLAKNGVILVCDDEQNKPQFKYTSSCGTIIKVWNIESVMASQDKKTLESLMREVEYYVWPDIQSGLQPVVRYDTVPPSEVANVDGLIQKLTTEKVILSTKGLSLSSILLTYLAILVKIK